MHATYACHNIHIDHHIFFILLFKWSPTRSHALMLRLLKIVFVHQSLIAGLPSFIIMTAHQEHCSICVTSYANNINDVTW